MTIQRQRGGIQPFPSRRAIGMRAGECREVRGALLTADLSGFTALTERLSREGLRGNERLAHLLNRYFQTVLHAVRVENGEVLLFGGDSLMVAFPGSLERSRERGYRCARRIHHTLSPLLLQCKTSVRTGTWWEVLLGDARRQALVVLGSPVQNLARDEVALPSGALQVDGHPRTPGPPLLSPPPPSPSSLTPSPPFLPQGMRPNSSGEHRATVAVFLDVWGFQETPQDIPAIQRLFLTLLDLLDHHRGALIKVDRSPRGLKFLLTFGAPRATPTASLSALHTARSILQYLPPPLRGGGGIASGVVYTDILGTAWAGEYMVMGDPVNVGARLAQEARPGEVLVDATTHRHTAHAFSFRPRPAMHLKGKRTPLPVHELGDPLPVQSHPPLVGRKALIQEIHHALDRGCPLIGLRGDGGIGKTRVMQAVVHRLPSPRVLRTPTVPCPGVHSLWGNLLIASSTPSPPTRTPGALRDILREHPVKEIREAADTLGAMLFGLTPPPGSPYHRRSAINRRDTLYRGIQAWMQHHGVELLVLDDLHRATSLDLEILAHLLRNPPTSLQALVAFRPWHGEAAFLDLIRAVGGRIWTLKGLSPEAWEPLARTVLRRDLPPTRIATLQRLTGGHPLFLLHLLHHLRDHPDLQEGDLPETLWQIVASRMDALPDDLREGLILASLLGDSFNWDTVEALAGRSLSPTPAVRQGLLLPPGENGTTAFQNTAIREIVYASLSREHARSLHRKILQNPDVRERLPIEARAHHALQGEMGEEAWAFCMQVGQRYREQYRLDEARLWLQKALWVARFLHPPSPKEWVWATDRLAGVFGIQGVFAPMWALYRRMEVRAAEHSALQAVARQRQADLLWMEGRYDEALRILENTEPVLRGDTAGPYRKAWIQNLSLQSWLLGLQGRTREALDRVIRARSGFPSSFPEEETSMWRSLQALLHNDEGSLHHRLGAYPRAHTHFTAYLHTASSLRERNAQCIAWLNLGVVAERMGRLKRAEWYLEQARRLARRIGYRWALALVDGNLGVLHHSRGNLETARRCYLRGLRRIRALGDPREEGWLLGRLGYLTVVQGFPRRGGVLLCGALSRLTTPGDREHSGRCLAWLAEAQALVGEKSRGLETLQRAETLARDLALPPLSADVAASRSLVLHIAGDVAGSLQAYQDAADRYLRMGDLVRLAILRFRLGRRLREDGHPPGDRMLSRALRDFRRMGAQGWLLPRSPHGGGTR